MKKVNMVLIALLITAFAKSQTFINAAMGYTNGSKMIYNYNTHEEQKLKSQFLYFSMNGGYKYKDWIAEAGGMFNGAVIGNLLAGRKVGPVQLMGGMGTEINERLQMKVQPQGLIRFISGHLQLEARYMPNTVQIGIGVIGWRGEDF